jgi:hypothetical protein
MEDAVADPRFLVAQLGGLLILFGLVWIVVTEVAERKTTRTELTTTDWPDVVRYVLTRVPAKHFVAVLLIVLGAAVAVGAVWTAPAPSTDAKASPSPG